MDAFQAAWKALDELALTLRDPTLVRAAQGANREILGWYFNAAQQDAQIAYSAESPVPNGKAKAEKVGP